MSEELEVTESQPDLWPIREEEVAGAAVEGGWTGQREGLFGQEKYRDTLEQMT